ELDAATKTASLPETLTLDQVWITGEGRAKLLDFAAPGSVTIATGAEHLAPNIFLHQVAIAALEGRKVSGQEAAARSIAVPLPISARQTLLGLKSTTNLHSTASQLQALTQQPAEVSRWRRFALMFGTLLPSLFMTAFMIMGLMYYQSWSVKNPAFSAVRGCMLSYESMLKGAKQPGLENIPVPEAKAAMETYISAIYGPIVRDPQQWDNPISQSVLPPHLRTALEKMVKEHPQPAPEEVAKARMLLQPLLDIRVAERAKEIGLNKSHSYDFISTSVMSVYLVFTAFFSLFCAIAFRGGLIMRILGITVVKDDGTDASRGRLLWRGLIAWSPLMLLLAFAASIVPFFVKSSGAAMMYTEVLGLVILAVLTFLAAIAPRGRGLHDRLAKTWLVPR
ncbi:MAG: prkC 11, partial [Prosthecobacter sp.]|nr:prkC 11 [Prosthecobacter sp.]